MCIPWGQKRTYKLLFSLSAMWSLTNNLKLPSLVAKCLYLLKHLIGLCFGLVLETGSLCSPDWPPAQKDLSASATKLVLGLKACATTTVVLRQLSVALNSLCSWRCLWTPDPSLCSASDWTRGFVSTRQAPSVELRPQPPSVYKRKEIFLLVNLTNLTGKPAESCSTHEYCSVTKPLSFLCGSKIVHDFLFLIGSFQKCP